MSDLMDILKAMHPDAPPVPSENKGHKSKPKISKCSTCGTGFASARLLTVHAAKCLKEAEDSAKSASEEKPPEGSKYSTHAYGEILHQTAKATLFRYNNEQFWLPKRKVEILEASKTVRYPSWIKLSLKPYKKWERKS